MNLYEIASHMAGRKTYEVVLVSGDAETRVLVPGQLRKTKDWVEEAVQKRIGFIISAPSSLS